MCGEHENKQKEAGIDPFKKDLPSSGGWWFLDTWTACWTPSLEPSRGWWSGGPRSGRPSRSPAHQSGLSKLGRDMTDPFYKRALGHFTKSFLKGWFKKIQPFCWMEKRSGKQPVWPDWAKFCHFGNIQKAFVNFVRVHLVYGEILKPLWQLFNVNGPIFTVVNGQILNK